MNNKFTILLIACFSALVAWQLKPEVKPAPLPVPLVSVQEMGALVSLKVNYANIIDFNKRVTQDIPGTPWELRFGGAHVLLIARGECLIGTDLKLAKYEQSLSEANTATLVVPQPKVISARLNHDPKTGGSSVYEVSTNGLVALVPGTVESTKAVNLALEQGQSDIEASCAKPELIDAARKSAEAVLIPTVTATGWRVAIEWR